METRRSGISEESAHGLSLYGSTTASARRCDDGGQVDKEGQRGEVAEVAARGGGGGQGAATTYDLWMGTRNERGGLEEGGCFSQSGAETSARGTKICLSRIFFVKKSQHNYYEK
jgi:hypothetical protein